MSDLPEGWVEVQLKHLRGPKTKSLNPASLPEEQFQLFSVPAYEEMRPEMPFGADIGSTKQEVEPSDVLLCKIVPHLKRVWVVPQKGELRQIASGEWIRYRTSVSDPHFLRYFMLEEGFRAKFMSNVSGVGGSLMRARPKAVDEIKLPLPPLLEQGRIVEKLDALSAQSAAARTALTRIETLITRYRAAVLARFFSNSGALAKLDEAIESTFYGPRFSKNAYTDEGIVTLRTTDFTDLGEVMPKDPPKVFVREAEYEKWGLIEGDLLVTRTGSIGKCAVYSEAMGPALPSAYLIRVRLLLDKINPRYAFLFLQSPRGQSQLGLGVTAVTQPNINAGVIRDLELPLPPLEEQAEIVARIKAAFTQIEALACATAAARARLTELDRALLTRAFQGKLVPQNPNDEPASELLKRIKTTTPTSAKPRSKPPRTKKRRSRLTKSRFDDDVKGKPYLAAALRSLEHPITAEELYRQADLTVADFYKQLAFEVSEGLVRDLGDKLEAS